MVKKFKRLKPPGDAPLLDYLAKNRNMLRKKQERRKITQMFENFENRMAVKERAKKILEYIAEEERIQGRELTESEKEEIIRAYDAKMEKLKQQGAERERQRKLQEAEDRRNKVSAEQRKALERRKRLEEKDTLCERIINRILLEDNPRYSEEEYRKELTNAIKDLNIFISALSPDDTRRYQLLSSLISEEGNRRNPSLRDLLHQNMGHHLRNLSKREIMIDILNRLGQQTRDAERRLSVTGLIKWLSE